MEVVPAFLERDFSDIQQKAGCFVGVAPIVQIDICDGVFVPTKTWPYTVTDDADVLQNVELDKLKTVPISFELDLMIRNPEQVLGRWLLTKPARAVLHWESATDLSMALAILRGYQIDNPKFMFGLAVPPTVSIDVIAKYIRRVSFIQIMGIAQIGVQGQPFDESAITLATQLHTQYPELPIHIDGAVSAENISKLYELGVASVAVGSAIQNAPNQITAYAQLQALVK